MFKISIPDFITGKTSHTGDIVTESRPEVITYKAFHEVGESLQKAIDHYEQKINSQALTDKIHRQRVLRSKNCR
jgi:hypothetical protein